jgi:hypothetical protein
VVSLLEGRLSKTVPTVRSVNGPGSLESNIEVATLDGKVKPSALILNEMKRDLFHDVRLIGGFEESGTTNLWVPFLL